MNRGIYTAAMGMSAAQRWTDVAANNLANASTDGFKKDGLAFGDALVRQMRTGEGRGRQLGGLGSGPHETAEFTDRAEGTLRKTGNPLDLALEDPRAMFAVQDGTRTRFTRNGAFTLNSEGGLVTASGAKVLDDKGKPIGLDRKARVEIDPDGRVRQNGAPVARIGTFEGEFKKEGNALWTGTGTRAVESPIQVATLEGSNANPLEGMIDLVRLQRHMEMAQKAVTTHDESTGKLLTLLNK